MRATIDITELQTFSAKATDAAGGVQNIAVMGNNVTHFDAVANNILQI